MSKKNVTKAILLISLIFVLFFGINGCKRNAASPTLQPNNQAEGSTAAVEKMTDTSTEPITITTETPTPEIPKTTPEKKTETTTATSTASGSSDGGITIIITPTKKPLNLQTATMQAIILLSKTPVPPTPTSTGGLTINLLPTSTLSVLQIKSKTPTATKALNTPTAKYTATKTPTPTKTPVPSKTPTPTKTTTPSKTPTKTITPTPTKTLVPTSTFTSTLIVTGNLYIDGQGVMGTHLVKYVDNCQYVPGIVIMQAGITVTRPAQVSYAYFFTSQYFENDEIGPYTVNFSGPGTQVFTDIPTTSLTCGDFNLKLYETAPENKLLDEYTLSVIQSAPTNTTAPFPTNTLQPVVTLPPITVVDTPTPIKIIFK